MSVFSSPLIPYVYLAFAVVFEVIGTAALKASETLTKPMPIVVMALSYMVTFFFMAQVMRYLPVGVTYAIWSGLGIVLISCISAFYFKEWLDVPAIIGLAMIIGGIIIIQVFSKTGAGA
jgi:small multidrug resistance pump